MRFSSLSKATALLLAATLLSAPMAEAGHTGEAGMEKAKEASSRGLAEEGVTEEVMVGEPKSHPHEKEKKQRKPRMATLGVQQTWKECVGMDVEEAVEMIKAARPDLRKVAKVPEASHLKRHLSHRIPGSMVTMDMRSDRVRIYYDTNNIVTRPPRVG
ncbi:unnamed protein product [Ectocarpus fasciculatus]